MKKEVFVINLKGEAEPFSFRKVYQSARNVGASKVLALAIASQIAKEVYPSISTEEIFDRVFELLLEKSPQSAIKFNLKKAIRKLGPTGFPFEKFIGKVFASQGFKVELNQILAGQCVNYEIDFIAQKDQLVYIGECKFRQLPSEMIDLQIALANYARFLDIKERKILNSRLNYQSILVTNTKFTKEAIQYSQCVGVELLGWKYPLGRGLEKLIEENKLYPITILPSVTSNLALELMEQKIVLAKDVFKKEFQKIKIFKKEKILQEAEFLLK